MRSLLSIALLLGACTGQLPTGDDPGPSPDAGLAPEPDAPEEPAEETDPDAIVCEMTFGYEGGLRRVFHYDSRGNLRSIDSIFEDDVRVATLDWDSSFLSSVHTTTESETVRSYRNTPNGRRIEAINRKTSKVSFSMDADGNLLTAVTHNLDGELTRTRTFRGSKGRIDEVIDELSYGDRAYRFEYDGQGRLETRNQHNDPDGPVSSALHLRRDASGMVTAFEWDNGGDGTIDARQTVDHQGDCAGIEDGWYLNGMPEPES